MSRETSEIKTYQRPMSLRTNSQSDIDHQFQSLDETKLGPGWSTHIYSLENKRLLENSTGIFHIIMNNQSGSGSWARVLGITNQDQGAGQEYFN